MRRLIFIALQLLSPVILLAQTGVITGKILRADTKEPLAKVSVFLSNATVGTTTSEDGTYTLRGIRPGQYDLVMTSVGYEEKTQQVLVGSQALTINAELKPQVMQLGEVIVTDNANWKANYAMFLTEFLGTSANAKQCKITNPHDITLIYRRSKKTLEAFSYDFINIENRALGYRVKFLLRSFKSDKLNNLISWQGRLLYEDLPGSEAQKRKWEERRQDTYYGSSLHFFRSLVSGNYAKEGFIMNILSRRPNPERPPQELIMKKIDQFQMVNRDSINYWVRMYELPKYQERLDRQIITPDQVVHPTERNGLYAIQFPECLYVIYTKKREMMDFKDIYRPLDMPNFEVSVVTLYKPYAVFDNNGAVVSAQSTLFEGTWSKSKVAELLPVDYVPSASYTPPYLK